ncbi:MAG: hypothetical protein IJS86_01755, partial [Lachnospiraceae bacterium]|nr:hypothetical protein [Lachnospiraceae bacterium]
MKKNRRQRLYKKRMAMLLAVILTFTGVIPAGAAEPVDVPVSVNETASGEVSVSEPETVSTEDAVEAAEPAQEAVSGDETVSADGTVSADDTKDAAGTVSDNISGDAVSADTVSEDNAKGEDAPADVTIMYYIVGSDLERRNVQATKDIMEIMTGMLWAERAGIDEEFRSKINVIAETGGLSFKGDGQETEEQKRNAYRSAHAELRKSITASDDTLMIYDAIKDKIKWNENERWVLSSTSINKAKNDEGMDRDRVMSHHKSTGDAPELEDFIVTTAKEYPAKNYMLVLWDHGGGPEGGYAGDERADSKENGYITSEQLSKTLSDASLKIRESGQDDNGDTLQSGAVSVNAGFEKLAFLGFDACLMGNLETAMAVTPYAEYLFASEDLEAGTGWDHRGYVKTLVETDAGDYEKDKIGATTRKIGCRMADDMMKWYEDEEDTDTISVISLNEVMLKDLDEKIGALANAVVYWMLAGNNGAFNATDYPKFLKALQKSIHFNGNTSGMLDLYSLCTEIISINGVPGEVKTDAINVQKAIRPDGFEHDNANDTNHGPVIYESYTSHYPFVKYIEADDENKEKLGGLTVFFPHDEFRYKTEAGKTVDFLKSYLDIYYNTDGSKGIKDANKLEYGYRSLLETFCTIQTVGAAMEEGFDKDDSAVVKEMKEAAAAVKADYKLSEGSIACKTADNMTVSDGLVRSRITVSDLSMKTVVSNGSLLYVYDVASAEKKDMITKITSQMTFTDESGKIHRLGYMPDMEEPEALGDTGKYRFIPKNRNFAQWFYIGDVPAAVYNIENLEKDGDPVFFDALNQDIPVLVRIPAVIRRPTLSSDGTPINLEKEYSEETVIIEAELSANSLNVIPNGYYQINYDQKQLFGFVPWKDVSDYATFWALSDLTEFIFGSTTDFAEDNYDTIYSTAMSKNSISINRTNVGEDIAGLKFNYNMQDVFGGIYELDSLYSGERVKVSLTLQKKGKETNITDINLGEDGIYPKYVYSTDGYSLSLNKNLPVGYYDTAGTFHDLDDPSDFKALKPGTYDIVFKYYDNDKYAVTPEAGTTVSVAGVEGGIDPALYSFVPEYVPSLTLTVYDKNSPFTIEKKADIPYGFVKTMKPAEDMSNFVSVKNGDGDVTKSYLTRFVVNINGKTYDLGTTQLDEFKKLEPDPGTKMTVSADFYIDGDYRPCTGVAELTIVKQPVSLVGVNRMYSSEFINESIFWDKEFLDGPDEYKPEVQILMQYDGMVYDDGDRSFGNYIGKKMNIGELVSKNTVSSVAIDISSLDGARLYKDLPIGPKREGVKRPGFWQPEDFVSDFAKYYTVENYEDAVLKEYELLPASKVTFRSLKGTDEDDDAELCPGIYIGCDKGNLKDGLWSLSDDLIHISGNEVRQWYVRIGDNRREPVWIDGEPVLYYDYVTEKEKQL